MYRDIATTLYKRGAAAAMDGHHLPSWALIVVLINVAVFFPIFLIVSYTFQHVYPTLAIVEDPSPPAYEPVALNEDGQSIVEDGLTTADEAAVSAQPLVTSSLRSTHRAVYAIAGWKSLFRGYGAYLFTSFASFFAFFLLLAGYAAILFPFAVVILAQLHTAWTHIVISAPSSKSFWQRLPPFKRNFKATALPMIFYGIAQNGSSILLRLLADGLGMTNWKGSNPSTLPEYKGSDIWKGLVVIVVALVLQIFLIIPNQVVLVRVQASLLPEEDDTIVPFDRSFGGKVEPAIVGGKGYIGMIDAWKSFPLSSWIRLAKIYAQLFLIMAGVSFAWAAIWILEFILITNASRKTGDL